MGGGIGQGAQTRDEFICTALGYVHGFKERVALEKEQLSYNNDQGNAQQICQVLDEWAADAFHVNPVLLAKLAMKDWDDRLEEMEEEL